MPPFGLLGVRSRLGNRLRALLFSLIATCPIVVHAAPVLTVALGETKPPYVVADPPSGIEYDIVSAVFVEMGYPVKMVFLPNARAHLMLTAGEVDAVIGNNGGFLSEPYIAYQNAAITLAKRNIVLNKPADLQHYRVTAFQNAHLYLGDAFAEQAKHNPDYQETSPQVNANRLLYTGRTDVVIGDVNIFHQLNQQIAMQVDTTQAVKVHRLFPPTLYRLVFRDMNLRDSFNAALKRLQATDLYAKLAQRYLQPLGAGTEVYFKPPQ